ncbi:hypothetical protein MHY1_02496 [Methylovirgula sp. HY1]|nr:hypothetical protein MHY1_02496 [Methylovirgula sp. HY1]
MEVKDRDLLWSEYAADLPEFDSDMTMAPTLSPTRRGSSSWMPTCFTQGFRPFFLATALWSVAALALWIGMLATGIPLPSRFDPLSWHIHEMLFGFGMAAAAGFLLTAVPNWTKRLPVAGAPLAMLVGLWLLGRLVCATSALMPAWLAIVFDLAFPLVLIGVIAREIIAGKNWHNLPMTAPLLVLTAANLAMHLEAIGVDVPAGLGWRLGLAAMITLMSVVGGRIIPSFTRNWLAKRGSDLTAQNSWLTRAAMATLHTGLLGWAFLPDSPLFGGLLVLGGALNLWRLWSWRGVATIAEPLLLILHVGYAWLAAGAMLLGLAVLGSVPLPAAIHALTAGAMGTMILAVMTRVARGHSGRDLSADRVTIAIYLLVTFAALFRVAAAFVMPGPGPLLYASAGLWIAAFALFAIAYGRMLLFKRGR